MCIDKTLSLQKISTQQIPLNFHEFIQNYTDIMAHKLGNIIRVLYLHNYTKNIILLKLFLCIDWIFGRLEHKFERILFMKRNHVRNVRRFQTVKAGIEITKKVQIQGHISIGIRSLHQNGIWVGIRILTKKILD